MKKFLFTLLSISVFQFSFLTFNSSAQNRHDKAIYKEYKPGYYQNTIMRGITDESEKKAPPKMQKYFKMDPTGLDVPTSPSQFTSVFRNTPISQGNTGTCWSFSTTSFYETEINRITKQNISLSQLFTVYWEYVDKAKGFVNTRGESNFDEGSEANAVKRIYKEYGSVPYEDFPGYAGDIKIYNHSVMVAEIKNYLKSVKESNAWNEDEVIATIKSILNHYIGTPPTSVTWEKKVYTPKDFLLQVCKLNMDDYVDVISLMEQPYFTQMEYRVPDNWWHDSSYYNVPLDTFMAIIKRGIRAGYSITIGGDVSEPGYNMNNVCMIPSFDCPSEFINENARQFRFNNGTTSDDHGLHMVGYMQKNGKDWYLIKDSGSGSRNVGAGNESFGYYYFDEDYVKLKMIDITIHKDVIKNLWNQFPTHRG